MTTLWLPGRLRNSARPRALMAAKAGVMFSRLWSDMQHHFTCFCPAMAPVGLVFLLYLMAIPVHRTLRSRPACA